MKNLDYHIKIGVMFKVILGRNILVVIFPNLLVDSAWYEFGNLEEIYLSNNLAFYFLFGFERKVADFQLLFGIFEDQINWIFNL